MANCVMVIAGEEKTIEVVGVKLSRGLNVLYIPVCLNRQTPIYVRDKRASAPPRPALIHSIRK